MSSPEREPPPHGPWPVRVGRRMWDAGREIELMHRALGFSALGLVTLVPLLIVIAAATGGAGGFVSWMRAGLGVSGRSAHAVDVLFTPPARVLSTTTAVSVVATSVFGVSFVASIQVGYERVWGVRSAPWHATWRRAIALAVLIGYLLAAANSAGWLAGTRSAEPAIRLAVTVAGGLLFFWWLPYFLLRGRVERGALLPGAAATVVGLVGLRFFSAWVFSPWIASSAVSYGPIGTVLVVQSWLIGIGFVIHAGALFGWSLVEHRRHRHAMPHPPP